MQVFQNKPATVVKPDARAPAENSGFSKNPNAEAKTGGMPQSGEAIEKPKNKGGRPRKHQVEAGQPRPVSPSFNSGKSSFPKPTGGASIKKFVDFLKYWQTLTPAMESRCRVHVYRKWPVIDRTLSGEKNQSIHIFQEDPIAGTKGRCHYELVGWEQQVLHEFGSGDYKYLLNEIGVTGVIAMCDFVVVRDVMIPPKLNYDELNKGDRLNADYIAGLRRQGIKLPGDSGYTSREEKAEEEMAQQLGTVERMADKMMEMAERQVNHPPPQARSLDDVGAARSIEMVAKAADRAGEIVQVAQAQAAQLQSKQVDPLMMMGALADVVEKIAPKNNGQNDLMLKMFMDMAERAEARTEALQREMRDREERRAKDDREHRDREEARRAREEEARIKADSEKKEAEKPKTLIEQLRELRETNELLGIKKGKTSIGEDEDEKDSKTDIIETVVKYLPLAVTGLTTIFSLGANIYYNSKLQPGEAPQPVPTVGTQQTQQQLQQIATGATPEQDAQNAQLQIFLQSIEGPFLSHFFNTELDGHTFANHLYTSHPMQGPMIYAQVKAAGKDQLIATLSTYPPIWDRVHQMQPQLQQFADEFMEYEEWKNSLNETESEEEKKEAVN